MSRGLSLKDADIGDRVWAMNHDTEDCMVMFLIPSGYRQSVVVTLTFGPWMMCFSQERCYGTVDTKFWKS
jgi:hypothetical protein